jgi:hypothetical protein
MGSGGTALAVATKPSIPEEKTLFREHAIAFRLLERAPRFFDVFAFLVRYRLSAA